MTPSPRPHLSRRFRVALWRGRWLLAAAGLLVAARFLIPALVPQASPMAEVAVAARDIEPGTELSSADLAIERVPASVAPASSFPDAAPLVGRYAAVGLPRGHVVTSQALVGPGLTTAAGEVVAPIRPGDPGLVGVLRPGDRVDVLAADGVGGPASVVAAGVRVTATLPGEDPAGNAATVLVSVTRAQARALAGAAAHSTLSLALVS